MSQAACMTALCQCNMGAVPTPLKVLPVNQALTAFKSLGNIADHMPFVNITPFGVCKSMGNPMTAALTAAAFGVLTPGPCLPMTFGPWSPGSPTVQLKGQPTLNKDAILTCSFGGVIKINFPGQATVTLP